MSVHLVWATKKLSQPKLGWIYISPEQIHHPITIFSGISTTLDLFSLKAGFYRVFSMYVFVPRRSGVVFTSQCGTSPLLIDSGGRILYHDYFASSILRHLTLLELRYENVLSSVFSSRH